VSRVRMAGLVPRCDWHYAPGASFGVGADPSASPRPLITRVVPRSHLSFSALLAPNAPPPPRVLGTRNVGTRTCEPLPDGLGGLETPSTLLPWMRVSLELLPMSQLRTTCSGSVQTDNGRRPCRNTTLHPSGYCHVHCSADRHREECVSAHRSGVPNRGSQHLMTPHHSASHQ
jgi:hypothetical protein